MFFEDVTTATIEHTVNTTDSYFWALERQHIVIETSSIFTLHSLELRRGTRARRVVAWPSTWRRRARVEQLG